MFGLRCAQSAPAAAVGCTAAWRPRGAAGSGAGESATRLTQAEGEMDNMLAVTGSTLSPWSSWVWGQLLLASLKQKVR